MFTYLKKYSFRKQCNYACNAYILETMIQLWNLMI